MVHYAHTVLRNRDMERAASRGVVEMRASS
jgi:hypothetical protein